MKKKQTKKKIQTKKIFIGMYGSLNLYYSVEKYTCKSEEEFFLKLLQERLTLIK